MQKNTQHYMQDNMSENMPNYKQNNMPNNAQAVSSNSSGFTLIELMITIAIAAILLGLAAPSFQQTIQNNRMVSQTNELIAAINSARQIAIAEGATTIICASNNPNAATPACATSSEGTASWNQGYLIYTKRLNTVTDNTLASYGLNANDSLVKVGTLQNNSYRIDRSDSATLELTHIGFLSNGSIFIDDSPGITVCDKRAGLHGNTIALTKSGSITRSKYNCPAVPATPSDD